MEAKVRASGLRGYAELTSKLGGDPHKLAMQCGIDLASLSDDDTLIPYRKLIQLLETSAQTLKQPRFGLKLAGNQDISILGPLAVAMQHAATVEEALECAAKYIYVQSPALVFGVNKAAGDVKLTLRIQIAGMPHDHMSQAEDLALGVLHGVLTMLANDHYQLRSAHIRHRPLGNAQDYSDFFKAPVSFESDEIALIVSPSTISPGLHSRNKVLHAMAATFLDVQRPSADGLISTRVERAIRKMLGTESCNRKGIAEAMAIHPRTLQRRLDQEGTSFEQIKEQIRKERIRYYLADTQIPLSQIASAVGYAEQAVLTRVCKRWFNKSPRQLRAALQERSF